MLNVKKNPRFSLTRRRALLALSIVAALVLAPSAALAGAYDDFFRAVKLDDPDTIKGLLRRGLDPNLIEAERGDTGLILAMREDSLKVFDVLLNARGIDLEAKARNGDTAMMLAAYKGNLRAVEAMLEKGAEPNKPGWTPLHYAATTGHHEIVKLLLDHSAYIDAESPNKTTPIMMAARGGHILTIKLLLDEGADASLKNDLGMSALDFARKFEFKDIVEGLTFRLKREGKL